MSIVTTKKEVFDIMDEFYFLYYEKGQIVRELDEPAVEAPIVLLAMREMLEHWGDDGEALYKIKQTMILEDLKEVIPPDDFPHLWL